MSGKVYEKRKAYIIGTNTPNKAELRKEFDRITKAVDFDDDELSKDKVFTLIETFRENTGFELKDLEYKKNPGLRKVTTLLNYPVITPIVDDAMTDGKSGKKKASGGATGNVDKEKVIIDKVNQADTDGNGKLTKEEYDNANLGDLDGDGKQDNKVLTAEEREEATDKNIDDAIPNLLEANEILENAMSPFLSREEQSKRREEERRENPIELPTDEEIMAEVERQRKEPTPEEIETERERQRQEFLNNRPKEEENEPVNINNKPINNNVSIDMNKQKVSLTEDNAQPTSVDTIPDSRKSTDNKSETQLRSDINYFFNNFGSQLKSISSQQKSVAKMSKPMLIRLHKRILGILQPKQKGDLDSSRKVGVVIDAEEYIKRKVNEVLIDNAMKGFQIPNLQPVGNLDSKKDDETKDIGSYEVKRGPDGGLNSNKEPVYRYIPTTQDEEVKEINYDYESRRGPKRLQIPKLKQRNRTTTAQREVRNNPFNKKQGGHRLNVIL